ncbi:MAG: hypothetical protein IPJ16_01495 [Bacteroidales bacterium]|nr:hypothetical protein [Bacteroidales bacterium]
MKNAILFLFMTFSLISSGQNLPAGATKTAYPCTLAKGLSSYSFIKNNEVIAMVEPSGCNYSNSDDSKPKTTYQADFFPSSAKKSFATNDEATAWILAEIEKYYKPIQVSKWQKLDNTTPKVSLSYPDGWSFKTKKQDWITKNNTTSNDRLVLTLKDSEIIQIIRTPNSDKLTLKQFMDNTSRWNPAIDFKANPATDQVIGGKTFKTMEHTFAMMMLQRHYWYADDKEIIYIGYGLLKDDRIRYPGVVSEIIKGIKW